MLRSTADAIEKLKQYDELLTIDTPIEDTLVAAAIARQQYAKQGKAVLFTKLCDSPFPAAANLFGTEKRARLLLPGFDDASRLIRAKVNPKEASKHPFKMLGSIYNALPRHTRNPACLAQTIRSSDIPAIQSWPKDGGRFITLPQVLTQDPSQPGWRHSNIGMYRVQLTGNNFNDQLCGLHYQIHRGIGIHHKAAIAAGKPLRVCIAIGGSPAMTLAAVMPLPEGMPELAFAGVLAKQPIRIHYKNGVLVPADADFIITGTIHPKTMPEGPFGDHLGYYSLTHPFPALEIEHVSARENAIMPLTVVGRPPQEDTTFGALIHSLAGPALPNEVTGLVDAHAVDAAGVHPLLLATSKERYTPYQDTQRPAETLTVAHALLGKGQLSLAKVLCIAADGPQTPSPHHVEAFFKHLLEHIDPARDQHFVSCTTMDTLDYSSQTLNEGSKLILACAGTPKRTLATALPKDLTVPSPFTNASMPIPGTVCISAPTNTDIQALLGILNDSLKQQLPAQQYPLWTLCDDATMNAATLNNWLWATFTRMDPARDCHGMDSFILDKHFGCHGAMVWDTRLKPWQAPVLETIPDTEQMANQLIKQAES